MTNFSYSVKTKIRTDKKKEDNTCPIFLQVIINRKIKKLSVKGGNVDVNDWDSTTGRAKGKGYKILNAMLDREEQRFKNFMWENKINGQTPTMEQINKFWNGNNVFNDDFFVFYQKFCDNHFKEIKISTTKHYITLGKKLKKFKPDLRLSEINLALLNEFKTFLEETKSGVYNMIKTMKATLNYAVENEFLKDETWRRVKKPKCKTKNIYLNREEILMLKNLDLSDKPRLKQVRDMFLFSYLTGIRHCDVIQLTIKDIKGGVLKFVQQKNGGDVTIPLSKDALNIIKNYIPNKTEEETLFSEYSNTLTNKRLKQVIEKAKIKKKFSFHTARHSFATTLANTGKNHLIISKMMGHSQPRQTFTYVHTNVLQMKEVLNNTNFM